MSPDLERGLAHYLRVRSLQSGAWRIGPFVAGFDADSTNPFRNYAVPDDLSDPAKADVEALVDAYRQRGRVPRVEYFPRAAPAVEGRLLPAGFVVERRVPVMVCRPTATAAPPPPEGMEMEVVAAGETIADAVTTAHVAFGERGTPGGPDFERLRQALDAGGGAVVARDTRTGRVVGTGQFPAPVDGVTELNGIAVLAEFRRRGVVAGVTGALVALTAARGTELVWLSPEGPGAERVYRRAGFATVSEALHAHHEPRAAGGGGRGRAR